jgi:hypothetical protein
MMMLSLNFFWMKKRIAMTNVPTSNQMPPSKAIVKAMDDLPILARLQFVKNIIFDRAANLDIPEQCEEVLIIAHNVLNGVVEVLEANPTSAQLRSPEP